MADHEKPTYDVFLSHNSADKSAVEAIGNRLREAGFNPFLDKWHLVPGKPWQTELADALKQSACTAIFLGPSGEGAWHIQEMQVALNNAVRTRDDYRVIPVLLPGSAPSQVDGFLELRTWVDFRTGLDDEVAFQRLAAAINGVAPDSAEGLLELPDEPRPYRGIERFEGEQQQFFFGRDEEIRRLIERLEQDRFVAVVGASGSGKSSLARAGFCTDAAEQAKPGVRNWRRIVLVPKNNPLLQLAANLVAHLPESERPALIKTFINDLRSSPDGLVTALSTLFPNPDQPVLLLIDQFEELFTQRPPSDLDQTEWHERTASFAANLLATVNHKLDWLRIVVTLRADFVDRFVGGDFPDFRTLLERRQFWLGAMGEEDLREVIARPATQRGAFFEKGLVERILTEMRGEASALPLLEEALAALWKERRGPWLTHQVYDDIGGVGGALADKADNIFNNLKQADQAIARRVFLKLIQLGEGTRDTRRRVSIASLQSVTDLPSDFQTVLERFSTVGARLITFSSDKETDQGEETPSDKTAEVTHEALIEHWDRLSHWLDEGRDDARLERRLEEASEYWKAESEKPDGMPDGLLWRPPDLDLAREYVERIEGSLPKLQFDFFQLSDRAERQHIAKEEEQRRRELEQERKLAEEQAKRAREQRAAATRFKWLASLAGVVALVAVGIGVYALAMRSEAEGAKEDALDKKGIAEKATEDAKTSEANAIESERETQRKLGEANFLLSRIAWEQEHDPTKSTHYLCLAEEDFVLGKDSFKEASMHLHALERSRLGPERSFPSDGRVEGAKLLSNGARLITWSNDGTARLWDVEKGQELKQFKHEGKDQYGRTHRVLGAELVSDGARLMTWSDDGSARLWDVEKGQELQHFKHEGLNRFGGPFSVLGAELVSDGAHLLTWSEPDGTARRWDVGTGQELKQFKHQGWVLGAELVSDGARLLTWSSDGSARLWDLERGQELKQFKHERGVFGAELVSGGKRLLTWSEDGTARLWDVEKDQEMKQFKHQDWVLGAELVSDGARLLTWSSDGSARLWDIEKGQEMKQFNHEDLVIGAELVSDGARLLTWSSDGSARLWDLEKGQEPKQFKHEGRDQNGRTHRVIGAELVSDGARLLTWSSDGSARLWDVETDQELKQFKHEDWVLGAELVSAGARLLTWSSDGTARLWDVEKGQELKQFKHEGKDQYGRTHRVLGAELVSDGARLLTWSADGTMRLWDVEKVLELNQFVQPRVDGIEGGFGAELVSDGAHLLTWSEDGTARLWDIEKGQELKQFKHEDWVLGAELVSGGKRLLTWSVDRTARLWDADKGQEVKQFRQPMARGVLRADGAGVFNAELVSDGTRLLTWSDDGTARLWDVEKGRELKQFKHEDWVLGAELFSDGARLLTWSDDETVRLWDVDTSVPLEWRKLDWQVRTATIIDENTDQESEAFRVLKYDEWKKLRDKLFKDYGGFIDRK